MKTLRGLEKVCKAYGRIKCGTVLMVWDYANEVSVKESEMPPGSKRWSMSEKAKFKSLPSTPSLESITQKL